MKVEENEKKSILFINEEDYLYHNFWEAYHQPDLEIRGNPVIITRKYGKELRAAVIEENGDYAIYKIKMNSELDANSVFKALLYLERDWGLDFERIIILYDVKPPYAELFVAEKTIEENLFEI